MMSQSGINDKNDAVSAVTDDNQTQNDELQSAGWL